MQMSSAFILAFTTSLIIICNVGFLIGKKMSDEVGFNLSQAVSKTRNAILRMKKCSPELKMVLRQRCQERIHNNRLKILSTFRKIKIQDSFRAAFGNILKEEWKIIDDNCKNGSSQSSSEGLLTDMWPDEFNIDDKLIMEELLEKELLLEHEDWLLQLYEKLSEDIEESDEVVCPLCCSGYLRQVECHIFRRTLCTKCSADFIIEKSLLDLQAAIYECLAWHDKQCNYNSGFVNVPKNETENNLCIVCPHCSLLYVIE